MPQLIWFEWEKCPDGYTVEKLEPEFLSVWDEGQYKDIAHPSESAPVWVRKILQSVRTIDPQLLGEACFVPKSDKVLRFRPLEGADAAFMELSECCGSDSNTLQFIEKYGLLQDRTFPGGQVWLENWNVDAFQESAEWMSDAVKSWLDAKRTGDFDRLVNAFNTSTPFEDDDHEFDEDGPSIAAIQVQLRHPTGRSGLPILSIVSENLESALWLQFAQAVSSSTQLRRCAVCPTWFVYGTGTGRRKSAHYCSNKCRKAAHRRQKETKKSG